MSRTAIVVFARGPGRESKWLGLGERAEQRLHAHLLCRSLATAQAVEGVDVVLAGQDVPCRAAPSVRRIEQCGSDFGARLSNAIHVVRELGYERIVVIGTDTPQLSVDDLERAAHGVDVVIGPSVDGGVYLLAFDSVDVGRLRDVPWQTDRVAGVLRARFSHRTRHELSVRRDLDGVRDARCLRAFLARQYRASTGECLTNTSPPIRIEWPESSMAAGKWRALVTSPRGPPPFLR